VNAIFARIDRAIELLVAVIFAAMCIVGLMQVFNRFVLNVSLSWSEEAQVFGHIWLVFLAIPIAYQRGAHLYVDEIRRKFPRKFGMAFDLMVELLWAGFAVSLIYLTWRVALVADMQESPGLEVPMSYPYYGMMFGGVYLLLVAIRRIAAWFTGVPEQAAP
jgi:TRAP-type C4-dicarboxylate transport system permease small subunit